MQVACGQHFGDDGRRGSPQEPEPIGIDSRYEVANLGGVIPVVVLNIQPALDNRVSHHHADHVGSGAKQGIGRVPEPVEPTQPLERAGHEADNPHPLGHEHDRPPNAGNSAPQGACGLVRSRRGDAVVLDPEVIAILGGEQVALPVGRRPGQVALLQVEQLDGVGRAPPVNIGGRSLGGELVGEVVLAGVEVVVEKLYAGGGGRIDRGEQRGPEARWSGRRSGQWAGAGVLRALPSSRTRSRDCARASATRPRPAREPRRRPRTPAIPGRARPRPASALGAWRCGNRTQQR